jgi:hypothetical protein
MLCDASDECIASREYHCKTGLAKYRQLSKGAITA